MKIDVTAEDITNGVPDDCDNCPVALALQRETGRSFWVGDTSIGINGDSYYKQIEELGTMKQFIREFDNNCVVQPFSFELDYDPPATEALPQTPPSLEQSPAAPAEC